MREEKKSLVRIRKGFLFLILDGSFWAFRLRFIELKKKKKKKKNRIDRVICGPKHGVEVSNTLVNV